jgi:hypothetical protein
LAHPIRRAYLSVSRPSPGHLPGDFRALFADRSASGLKMGIRYKALIHFFIPTLAPSGTVGSLCNRSLCNKGVAIHMKYTLPIFFLLLLLLTMPLAADAQSCTTAVCNATGTSEAAFLAALPSSDNTNATVVVNVPAGTSGWTSQLSYTVPAAVTNLTIQGQTAMNCTGSPGTSSYACSATDNTIIQDSFTSGSNSSTIIFRMNGVNSTFRMTGLTIEGGTGNVKNDGIFNIDGPSHNVRLDHTHFNTTTYSTNFSTFTGRLFGDVAGVIDHVICDEGTSTSVSNCIGMSNPIGDTVGYGDGTWAAATGFGTSAFMFIEDSIMNGGELEDCDTGGKFVARYNSLLNGSVDSASIHTHGTKSEAGRGRGCRAYEAYHNYIKGPTSNDYAAIGTAAGTSLVWGNNLISGYNRLAAISATRNDGSAAETNTPNGWGYCGTTVNGNGVGSGWDGNSPSTTGFPCLDGLGRGQGQALNGQNFPSALNSVTGTIAFPAQKLEPIYYWGNTIPGGLTEMDLRDISSAFNKDVYIDKASFNGTSGTGNGLFSARPSTCTAGPGGTFGASPTTFVSGTPSYGVAYFATDANSGNGELYICTSTNTWTAVYQPYTYPHPLTGGGGTSGTGATAPSAATNLTGTVH